MIIRSTDIKAALRSRQRGFLLNPFRFGPPTPTDPLWGSVISHLAYESTFADSKAGAWTASGGAAAGVSAGLYGNSGSFPSAASNISRANVAINGAFTIETTFQVTSFAALQCIFRFGVDPLQSLAAYVNSSGVLQIYAKAAFAYTAPSALSAGQKYHIAASYTGTGSIGIYLDGKWVAYISTTGVLGTKNFYWGGDSYSQGLVGHLDESRITAAGRYTANFTPPSGPFPTA